MDYSKYSNMRRINSDCHSHIIERRAKNAFVYDACKELNILDHPKATLLMELSWGMSYEDGVDDMSYENGFKLVFNMAQLLLPLIL
jgi:hypothetical protein